MTLKTKKPKIIKTIFIVILVILLLVGAGVASFFIAKTISEANNNQSSGQNSSNTEPSQNGSSDDNPTTNSDNAENHAEETTDQTPAQYDGEDPNKAESLSGLITYSGVSEGAFLVNVSIDQYVSGSCDIVLENATGQTNTYQATIVAGPTSGFCSYEGPVPAAGTWKITVKINGNGKTGTVTGEVSI
ncbi:hypothetical protein IKW75_02770 [Candidatus Saccharibacteria bacterium]|nr:hypothetical protein [Candidatus Saccharibacteria bacterium]